MIDNYLAPISEKKICIHLSICIATYKRHRYLKELLERLDLLKIRFYSLLQIDVIVVDNDDLCSAKETVEKFKSISHLKVKYATESRKGVTYARNRAIKLIDRNSDYVIMIDDDEIPDKNWIDELLRVQAEWDADIVTGPVFPLYDADVPEWVINGGFFKPQRIPCGTLRSACFTNNVLIKADILRYLSEPFDNRLASKGAEDTYLFMKLSRFGKKIRWADKAVVRERIPSSRANVQWLLKRNFWGWSSYSLFEKKLYPSARRQIIRTLKGVGLILNGTSQIVPGVLLGKSYIIKSLVNIAKGAGTLAGLLGIQGKW